MSELAMPAPEARQGTEAVHATAARSMSNKAARWPRMLLVLVLIGATALVALAWIAHDLALWKAPVHVQIDGDEIFSGFKGQDLPPAHRVVLAAVLVTAALAALLIVPLAVLLVLLSLVAAVLLAVGLPVVLALGGLALLLSPLLLLCWLVWKIVT